jgi:hypothetical protein
MKRITLDLAAQLEDARAQRPAAVLRNVEPEFAKEPLVVGNYPRLAREKR